jgi:hypothetical protein
MGNDKENPFFALVPKDESPDGFAGEMLACVKLVKYGEG